MATRRSPKSSKKPKSKTAARVAPRKAPAKRAKSARKAAKPVRKAASRLAAKPKKAAPPKPAAPSAKLGKKVTKVTKRGPAIVQFKERAAPAAEARPLRLVVFGASGNIGRRITKEALSRGHHVTAVMRNPAKFDMTHPHLNALRADVTDPLLVATVAKGHDVIVSAISPSQDSPEVLAQAATAILQGAREAGIMRVVVVNGAGSLEVAKGKMLMDSPQFPREYRWIAQAHYDALKVLRAKGAGLDWTAVSPAAMIEPGKRTGKYRTGGDQLLADAKGNSTISMEDYAAALMDELEGEKYLGKRMTVAY